MEHTLMTNYRTAPGIILLVAAISTLCDSPACAAPMNDSLVGWGWNAFGQTDVSPGGDFAKLAGGGYHGLALKNDGSLVGWGYNNVGQTNVPAGNAFRAIAAGQYH